MMKQNKAPRSFTIQVSGRDFRFCTQPGVFSADGPDEGSLLLLDTVFPSLRPHQTVLDIGTGVGVLGIPIATRLTRGEAWLVDSDVRAARLAQRNVEQNEIDNAHVVLSDVTSDLPRKLRFDLVVSNPPTHEGKEVLAQIVMESYRVLRPRGSLCLVVNRLLSVKAMMSHTFGVTEVVARKHGFLVLRSEKARKPETR